MFVVDELWHTSENKSGINGSSPNFLCFSNLVINISLFLCKYGNEQKLGILAISLCLYFSYPGSDKLYIEGVDVYKCKVSNSIPVALILS